MLTIDEEFIQKLNSANQFLSDLYVSDSPYKRKKTLTSATKEELEVLAKVLHYITNQEIPLEMGRASRFKKTKRIPLLFRTFDSINKLTEFLEKSKAKQLQILNHIGNYHLLLHALFHD